MKLDYTISRIFQEMSLSELETLHQLCEFKRTHILQSLALAVVKKNHLQDIHYPEIDQVSLIMKEIKFGFTLVQQKCHLCLFLKICYKRIPIFYKNKVRRTYIWDTAVPCGSENSHNVVQLNPDEYKYYLLTPYTTLMQPLKTFSPESIRAIAHSPNIDFQSIGIYSK